MKKIIFVLILSIISSNVFAQAPSKKCPTCRQSMAKCKYKGRHPKQSPSKVNNSTLSKPSGSVNGHDYIDLGLSVKWATMNVGATSPSDYGGYYAWGETNTKSRYDWDNLFDHTGGGTDDSWRIYRKDGSLTSITPNSGHDTARENWGGTWRMPTDKECLDLCNKCKWTRCNINGTWGHKATGPNGNSIFLPSAGYFEHAKIFQLTGCGQYWSNMLFSDSSFDAYYLFIGGNQIIHNDSRSHGLSVRPVTE